MGHHSRPTHLAPVLAALATIASCTGGDRSGDIPLHWTAERFWSVGDAGDSPVSLSELYPFQIAVDDSGRLDVLGRREHRIYRWSADGRLLDSLGRDGSGPGEFQDALALSIDPAGALSVVDLGLRRIDRWSAAGELLDPIPITWHLDHPRMAFEGGRTWYQTVDAVGEGKAEIRLVMMDPGGPHVALAVARQPRRVVDFPTCGGKEISVQPFFAPAIAWAANGDLVAAAGGPEYRVIIWKGGRVVRILGRPLPALTATEALARREAEGYRFNGCLEPVAEVVGAIGFLPVIPMVEEVAIAPDGETWVRRRAPDGSLRIDLFDGTGSYEGTLPAGFPFPAALTRNGGIVALERDSTDIPIVAAYRIRKGAG